MKKIKELISMFKDYRFVVFYYEYCSFFCDNDKIMVKEN